MSISVPTKKARILLKNDSTENWNKATNFIPLLGEVIIYNDAGEDGEARIKMGDGTTLVADLPFIDEYITAAEIDEIVQ